MSIEHTYSRFCSIVRQKAPRCPIQPTTRADNQRAQAGRAASLISALVDGLAVAIPGAAYVDAAVQAATADSPEGAVNAGVDSAATAGAGFAFEGAAGPLVGGAIMLMRGTGQALERHDQVVTYLLGLGAFVNCLARSSMDAVNTSLPHPQMPRPIVPPYIERTGDLFSRWRRRAWNAGYWKVNEVFREIDTHRPVRGESYSKQCLIHLAVQAGHLGGRAEGHHLRVRFERHILSNILAANARADGNELRRWANAA